MRRFVIVGAVMLIVVLSYLLIKRVVDGADRRYFELSNRTFERHPECAAYDMSYPMEHPSGYTVNDLMRVSDLVVHGTVERVDFQQTDPYTDTRGDFYQIVEMVTFRTIQTYKGQHTAEVALAQHVAEVPMDMTPHSTHFSGASERFNRGDELVLFLKRGSEAWGYSPDVYFVPERLARYGVINGKLCYASSAQTSDYFPARTLSELIERIQHGDPFIMNPYTRPRLPAVDLTFLLGTPTPTAFARGTYPYPYPQLPTVVPTPNAP